MRRFELEAGAGALAEYYDWFKDARTGDVLVYWTGDLQADRGLVDFEKDWRIREPVSQLDAISLRVMKDASEGYLALSQQRLGEGRYEYRAVRRRLPKEASVDKERTRHALAVPA